MINELVGTAAVSELARIAEQEIKSAWKQERWHDMTAMIYKYNDMKDYVNRCYEQATRRVCP